MHLAWSEIFITQKKKRQARVNSSGISVPLLKYVPSKQKVGHDDFKNVLLSE
jgi:hypothetical protein